MAAPSSPVAPSVVTPSEVAPSVVVLTVAYHSQASLAHLAAALARQNRLPERWLVVNNAPGSAPLSPGDLPPLPLPLELLAGEQDAGFAAGCNRGLEHLEQQGWRGWVWLLNPDTDLPEADALERLAAALAGLPLQALVGTAVLAADGQLEASAGWLDPGLRYRRRRVTAPLRDQLLREGSRQERPRQGKLPQERPLQNSGGRLLPVDWLSGCSLCLCPSAHRPPARFDPAFPLYYEDVDLCRRLAQRGAPVLWLPEPAVTHQRGAGSQTAGPRRVRLASLSYLRFLRRHRPGWVLLLRTLRLLLRNLLLLPLQPRRAWAALSAIPAAWSDDAR